MLREVVETSKSLAGCIDGLEAQEKASYSREFRIQLPNTGPEPTNVESGITPIIYTTCSQSAYIDCT